MSTSTPLYHLLLSLLSQHAQYKDFRHLKALSWMINALILSSKINLSEWESYIISQVTQAQSIARTYRTAEETSAVSSSRRWHYCLRLPCDVTIDGARRHPIVLKYLSPPTVVIIDQQRCSLFTIVFCWFFLSISAANCP